MKIALCQINPLLGALKQNVDRILDVWKQNAHKADLLVFPELCLTGYPIEDLVLNKSFLDECDKEVERLIAASNDNKGAIIVGAPEVVHGKVYNSAFVIHDGKIIGNVHKTHLPNYGVFDEKRTFSVGRKNKLIDIFNHKIGLLICEDAWSLEIGERLISEGAEILISINASPFDACKHEARYKVAKALVDATKCTYIYVNLVGGQDELVFDGGSFVLNDNADYILKPEFCHESVRLFDTGVTHQALAKGGESEDALIYNALVLGLRDYVWKNNFQEVVLGLSGGLDSSLVAAIAVDAIGSDNVIGVALPSNFSSTHSLEDAIDLAGRLSIKQDTLSIEPVFKAAQATLASMFEGTKSDVTEENLQSRTRGILLMALSNKYGYLVLSTGNKSEYAVGYATIYGDMCGGYAPIKDVYKTAAYSLAKWRNENVPATSLYPNLNVIPQNAITKEPSAELRPDQKDQDTLPPYEILDAILYQLIELDKSPSEVASLGFDLELSRKIYKMFIRSEYKRRQSAIGTKVSIKSLDKDRRYPITNNYMSE